MFELGGLNAGLELRYWTIDDGRGYIPKDDPGTCHRKFSSAPEGMAPPLCYIQRYNLDGSLEDIAPTTDFRCTRIH